MRKRLLFFLPMLLLAVLANAQNPVPVAGAVSKRPSQGGYEISKALDGNISTSYHSDFNKNAMPDTVDFYFNGAKSINKIDYTPRQSGINGIWTSLDVYYTTIDAPGVFVSKLKNINWAQTSTVKTIDMMASPIVKPYIVRIVIRAAGGNFSSCNEINFSSAEVGTIANAVDCDNPSAEDFSAYVTVKLNISSASVSPAANGGEDISRTYDNNTSTLYHSSYSGGGFPISLTYNFTGNPTADYINYIPRQDGGANGIFGKGEIWYKTAAVTTLTKLMDFDTGFSSSPYRISFPAPLTGVTQIVVKVLSGRNNFASCAEMQFYQQSSGGDLYTNVFADDLHATLKPGITQVDIDAISSPFFKSLAQCIFNKTYNSKYRVQAYDYYPNPGTVEGTLKTNGINRFENPTGIVLKADTKAVIFVGDTYGVNPILQVKDFALDKNATTDSYPLQKGMNVISIIHSGLAYIGYFSDKVNLQPISINIATGNVNGYYNPLTDTDNEWMQMLFNGVYSKLDLKGKYINLNIDKGPLARNSIVNGRELVGVYDSVVHTEYILNGLVKYNRVPKNHMFIKAANDGGGWYAGGDGVHLDLGWGEPNVTNAKRLDLWGIAHELGHNNQVRPGAKWVGMTEVTNNINSAWVTYTFNNDIRLEKESQVPKAGISGIQGGWYNMLFDRTLVQKKNIQSQGDGFACLLPFWQLELYYQLAGAGKNLPTLQQRLSGTPAPAGQADVAYWYADVLEKMRTTSQSGVNNGQLVLNFVSAACDAVQEDLTDFFVKSGYLLPIDKDIDDYGVQHITITQAQIDAFIAAIQAKGYPKPVSPVLNYISANSVNTYKNRAPLTGTTAIGVTVNTGVLKIDNTKWANAVAFETYNQKTLTDVAIFGTGDATAANTTTTVQYATGSTSVYAIGYDGVRKLVYPAVDPADVLPVVVISSPSNSSVLTAGSNVIINASASDTDGTITKVEFYQGSTLLGQSTVAPYSFTWNSPAVGTYALTAKATDNNGGTRVSDTVRIFINTLPTVAISSPSSSAVFSAGSNVAVIASATDANGTVSKVEFYQGSTLLGQSTVAPYSFTWNSPAVGTYALTAKATDNNGGITVSDTVKITINARPTVAINSPSNNAVLTAGSNVIVNAGATDADGTVTKVEFYQGSTLLGQSTAAPYSFTWNSPAVGTYALTAKATDNNGGVTVSDTVKMTINALPTVAISSPSNNAVLTAGSNVIVNASATDADGTVAKVEFYQGSILLGQSMIAPYSFTWNTVSAGTYQLTAKATDNNGGVTTSIAVNITVNTAPTVAITSPASGAIYAAGSNIVIKADAADADGTVAKVEFYQGSTLLGQSTAAPYSFTWNTVSAGAYMLTAKATDNNGGVTTSAAVNVAVSAAPTVAITSPANGATFASGSNITIKADAADADGMVSKVEFYQGSTLLGQSTVAPYSLAWNAVSAGTYVLTARATDNNGGVTTSAAVNVTVSTAPTVAITSPSSGATFASGSNITINADAADGDGTVAKVEFYQGNTLLGQSTAAPYSFVWGNVAPGSYSLTARATDNLGGISTSAIVEITINSAPQSLTMNPIADAFVRDGAFASTNYGTLSTLDVNNDDRSYFRESYLRFDYSSFMGATVNSAKLRVYVTRVNTDPSRAVSVYGIPNITWGESTITWNNQPSETGALLGKYTVRNTSGIWYELDVTAYINSQLAIGNKAISFRLINEGGKGPVTC